MLRAPIFRCAAATNLSWKDAPLRLSAMSVDAMTAVKRRTDGRVATSRRREHFRPNPSRSHSHRQTIPAACCVCGCRRMQTIQRLQLDFISGRALLGFRRTDKHSLPSHSRHGASCDGMSRAAPNGIDHDEKHGWDSPAYEALNKHNLMRTDWRVKTYGRGEWRTQHTSPPPRQSSSASRWATPRPRRSASTRSRGSALLVDELLPQDRRGRPAGAHDGGRPRRLRLPRQLGSAAGHPPLLGPLLPRRPERRAQQVGRLQRDHRNGDQWIVVVPQGFMWRTWASRCSSRRACISGARRRCTLTRASTSRSRSSASTTPCSPCYEAVTQNNGKQEVLAGGEVHLLTHRNHKFEKFITCKIQTDDLKRIEVMTGDNVLMHVDATVCGRSTMSSSAPRRRPRRCQGDKGQHRRAAESVHTIEKLRADVLKQAEASLSALIGKVKHLCPRRPSFRRAWRGPSSARRNEDGNTRGPGAAG